MEGWIRRCAYLMLVVTLCGCVGQDRPDDFRGGMRDAYAASAKLFSFVWTPGSFTDPHHEAAIRELLNRLSTDFHDVERMRREEDPGFQIVLQLQQNLLKDARDRFIFGDKDYARWQLRGLMSNCVACHSRVAAPVDFVGALPEGGDTGFDARYARAEFLVASRQYERAQQELLVLAREAPTSSEAMHALSTWLVGEVRARENATNAAVTLRNLLTERRFDSDHRRIINAWAKDLEALPKQVKQESALERAHKLLPSAEAQRMSLEEDMRRLVPTLKATALLHGFLSVKRPAQEREEALCLLGSAYARLPLRFLEVSRDLLLEQCIREFPGTESAQNAFAIIEAVSEEEHSGSGGLHLEPEESDELQELRALAYAKGDGQ